MSAMSYRSKRFTKAAIRPTPSTTAKSIMTAKVASLRSRMSIPETQFGTRSAAGMSRKMTSWEFTTHTFSRTSASRWTISQSPRHFHRLISELIMRGTPRMADRMSRFTQLRTAARLSFRNTAIRSELRRNRIPFRRYDVSDPIQAYEIKTCKCRRCCQHASADRRHG